MEKLINIIIGLFAGLKATRYGREILVFIISVLPILELRGGLLAASLLEVDPLVAYIISIIGNILPVPFILFFIKRIITTWFFTEFIAVIVTIKTKTY